MITRTDIAFAPLLPWPALAALGALALVLLGLALRRRLAGWALRAGALLVLAAALAGPALQSEIRAGLSDIVLLLEDRSASQDLGGRAAETAAAAEAVAADIAAMPDTELRRIRLGDAPQNGGTRIGAALAEALAAEPRGRVAGVVIVSDGQSHDSLPPAALPEAPVHLLLTGRAADWDRRLVISTAPAFGIIGEELLVRLRIEDMGAAPAAGAETTAEVAISIDGAPAVTSTVPVGVDLELPVTLAHGGQNVIRIEVPAAAGEITARNNAASVQINGLRDRLSVLLVSGEPYPGERTWRNLLKSDAGVDLVHFTILRPPEKQDGTPVSELSLIAFPTQELFVDKIEDFDLIIFDRYAERGILPAEYFQNMRRFVEAGGALLVAAGPEFATVDSLAYSPLGEILPGAPTGRIIEGPFLPRPSAEGLRHPVVAGLAKAQSGKDGAPGWGRWLRQVEITPRREGPDPGVTVAMTGAEGKPLLLLSRVGEGRVALLASDQAWLWDRGYEGGGPQLELLRRIAHWQMKEPELEEEALQAEIEPGTMTMTIVRRTMAGAADPVTVTGPGIGPDAGPGTGADAGPEGASAQVALTETAPGRFTARWTAPGPGLYRLASGDLSRVVAMGPASPREFEAPIASPEPLAPVLAATGGGVARLEAGVPEIRRVRAGGVTQGRGWLGIVPRGAAQTAEIRRRPLLPDWAALLLAAGLLVGAWLVEGRGRRDGGRKDGDRVDGGRVDGAA